MGAGSDEEGRDHGRVGSEEGGVSHVIRPGSQGKVRGDGVLWRGAGSVGGGGVSGCSAASGSVCLVSSLSGRLRAPSTRPWATGRGVLLLQLGSSSSELPTGAARNADITVGHWNYRGHQAVGVADVGAEREGLADPGGGLRRGESNNRD